MTEVDIAKILEDGKKINLYELMNKSSKQPINTILVVDDDRGQLKSLRSILDNQYLIIEAMRGAEAIEKYRENQDKIMALLLDIRLPDMLGFEVCKKIKEINPMIPVIFCTAFQTEYESKDIIQNKYNPHGYIQKNDETETNQILEHLKTAVEFYENRLKTKKQKENL